MSNEVDNILLDTRFSPADSNIKTINLKFIWHCFYSIVKVIIKEPPMEIIQNVSKAVHK